MFDLDKRLLYVGVSWRSIGRLADHADDKHWWRDVVEIKLVWFDDRESALAEEERAIFAERPIHNLIAGHMSPGEGPTTNRVVRLGDEWEELGEAAGVRKRAEVIRQLVRWYLRYPGSKLPERPPRRPPAE